MAGIGGEGTAIVLAFAGVLIVIIIIVIVYELIKKKRSVYTYQYGK